MTQIKHFIGDTLTYESKTITIRKVIGGGWYRVSYGFDTKGNDVCAVLRLHVSDTCPLSIKVN